MQPMEETVTILHFENDTKRTYAFQEMEMMKANPPDHKLKIRQNNNLIYKLLTTSGSGNDNHRQ